METLTEWSKVVAAEAARRALPAAPLSRRGRHPNCITNAVKGGIDFSTSAPSGHSPRPFRIARMSSRPHGGVSAFHQGCNAGHVWRGHGRAVAGLVPATFPRRVTYSHRARSSRLPRRNH